MCRRPVRLHAVPTTSPTRTPPSSSPPSREKPGSSAKQELFENWFTNWLFRAMHRLPIKRDSSDRAALRRIEELLKRGEPVVIFPEGRCSQTGKLQKIQPGAALMSINRTGAPIVPIGLMHTAELLPLRNGKAPPNQGPGDNRVRKTDLSVGVRQSPQRRPRRRSHQAPGRRDRQTDTPGRSSVRAGVRAPQEVTRRRGTSRRRLTSGLSSLLPLSGVGGRENEAGVEGSSPPPPNVTKRAWRSFSMPFVSTWSG